MLGIEKAQMSKSFIEYIIKDYYKNSGFDGAEVIVHLDDKDNIVADVIFDDNVPKSETTWACNGFDYC